MSVSENVWFNRKCFWLTRKRVSYNLMTVLHSTFWTVTCKTLSWRLEQN